MRIRVVLAVIAGNLASLVLVALAGFLTVRLTPFGRWAADLASGSSVQATAKYGDPISLLETGTFALAWLVGPVIALLGGATAAIIARKSDWRISTLSMVSLIALVSGAIPLIRFLAPVLYILASWLAMKAVVSHLRPSASSAA